MTVNTFSFLSPEMNKLIDEIGEIAMYWGFKKNHGRLWALLFLSKEPLDAKAIGSSLQISKGLVCLLLQDLLKHNIIVEADRTMKASRRYIAEPHAGEIMSQVFALRERKMIMQAKESLERVITTPPADQIPVQVDQAKTQKLLNFVEFIGSGLDSFIELQSNTRNTATAP